MITRKEFLLAAAAAAAGCASMRGFAVKGVSIGVQMWSVDDLWRKDAAGALRKLRAMGYEGVQSLGFYNLDWNELEKMLDGEGLRIVDMPFRMKHVEEDFARYLEFCQRFKIDFVYDPYQKFETEEEWRAHAKRLLAVQEKLAPHGIRVGYHNHQHELRQRFANGLCALDVLREAGLAMELDVGHAKLAGADPVAWLQQLRRRVPSIHAKPAGGDTVGGSKDANDWVSIFAAAAAAGARWAVVECETRRNTFEDVQTSANFLRTLG